MEVALSLWIEDRNQKRVPRIGPMVREKAKRLCAHFEEPDGSCSGKCTDGGLQASDESLEELKPHTLKSCWKKLCPALTAENYKEPVQIQTLTANIAEIANGVGRDGFEQIESSDIQQLLESQDEALTETDLEEMLISQPIEEEASTSTGNVTFNLKSLS
uniref:HTH CENPB-type domain-containing protein n=1 Tax=Glossina pallidipes TaxID=7398 RepID=A0A1A9ZYP8_GLOPL